MSDSPQQIALAFDSADDDDLVIIGTPRDAPVSQSHSTFRKIDMAKKQGNSISLSWGDLMVMLPRPLYERVFAAVTGPDYESRADGLIALLEAGLTCSA